MHQVPILRHGEPYTSLDVTVAPHYRTREPFVSVSKANAGLIRRDLRDQKTGREKLAAFSTVELLEICRLAADNFLKRLTSARQPKSIAGRLRVTSFRYHRHASRDGAPKHAEDSMVSLQKPEPLSTV